MPSRVPLPRPVIVSTEGGHTDFAPRDEVEIEAACDAGLARICITHAHHFKELQDVNARLWEDPYAAVARARRDLPKPDSSAAWSCAD